MNTTRSGILRDGPFSQVMATLVRMLDQSFNLLCLSCSSIRGSSARTPYRAGTPFVRDVHTSGIEPECMKLILGLVFQIGGLGVLVARVMSKFDTCHPHTPTSYLMMPYRSMALPMIFFL